MKLKFKTGFFGWKRVEVNSEDIKSIIGASTTIIILRDGNAIEVNEDVMVVRAKIEAAQGEEMVCRSPSFS